MWQEKKDVPADQKIPDTIQGVKTDILQNRFEPAADNGYCNTILGGIDIDPFRMVDGEFSSGTLGAIVIDKSSQERMLLSNYHVLCVNEGWHQWGDAAKRVTQPAPFGIQIASITRGTLDSKVDAAVARLDNLTKYTCGVQDVGTIAGTAAPELGMAVRKRGRTTGLTYGTIHGVDFTTKVHYGHGVGWVTFTDQVEIYPDTKRNPQFAAQGDSGSVIVNDAGQVVALLFATASESGGAATPIHTVLEQLNISMAIEGIGGYDLSSSADQAFAFDYAGTGKLDHLVFYRPGTGIIFILKKDLAGRFPPALESHSGIGGYDLSSPDDRAFAFDYAGTGKLDHLVFYRPGEGIIFILKKGGPGRFLPVYQATK
ncbi:MAG: hypothetical protein OJF47_001398 [Nitrospira sp.]|jgi:hypothetical protein|nr:MAG: hypothetical protein OJF47_001398 [Nitrospira sp.]